jgi:hypothetical protein
MSVICNGGTVETHVAIEERRVIIGHSKFAHKSAALSILTADYYDALWYAQAKCGRSGRFQSFATDRKQRCPRCFATESSVSPSEQVVHCKREPYDVYIGRPSKWGNPFSHKDGTLARFKVATREEAIAKYRERLLSSPLRHVLHELRGKVLGCWCKPLPCHGDVLAEMSAVSDE